MRLDDICKCRFFVTCVRDVGVLKSSIKSQIETVWCLTNTGFSFPRNIFVLIQTVRKWNGGGAFFFFHENVCHFEENLVASLCLTFINSQYTSGRCEDFLIQSCHRSSSALVQELCCYSKSTQQSEYIGNKSERSFAEGNRSTEYVSWCTESGCYILLVVLLRELNARVQDVLLDTRKKSCGARYRSTHMKSHFYWSVPDRLLQLCLLDRCPEPGYATESISASVLFTSFVIIHTMKFIQ